jgi:hypothetical protein
MADVASKQQTTASFLPTTVTRTKRNTELTKKLTNLMGKPEGKRSLGRPWRRWEDNINTLRTGDEFSRLWRFFFTTLKDR